MVNLVKDGQPVRMSKRAGTVVTMEDLVDVVGVDAARYALARSSADSTLDIDLDVLRAPDVQVSRAELGLPRRKCLLCGRDAAACARSRAHPLPALLARIDALLAEFDAR